MADSNIGGYLGDATGGIGQGLAFVLPESKANQYAMQLAQTHGNQLQEMARQKQAQQLATQKQYETDFRNAELPKVWGPFSDEINKRHSDLLAEAAGDWAKTGKSPWSTSDFTNKYNDRVTSMAAKANQFGQELTKRLAASRADKDGKLSEDSKKSLDDFYKGFMESKDKSSYLDKEMPDLKVRDFTVNDVAKTLKAVPKIIDSGDYEDTAPDSDKHKQQAYATVIGDPKYNALLMKYGIHPGGPDTTAYTYQKDEKGNNINSTGQRVFPTDQAYADYMAKQWIDDPNKEKDLVEIGISKEDPFAEQKIAQYIVDRNAALGKLVGDVSSKLDATVKSEHKYTGKASAEKHRQFTEQMSQKYLGISYENLSLAKQQKARLDAAKKNDLKAPYSEAMRTSVPHSGEILSQAFVGNPDYRAALGYKANSKGQVVEITVPAKWKLQTNALGEQHRVKVNEPHVISLDPNSPGEYSQVIGKLIKEAGGDKMLNQKLSLYNNQGSDSEVNNPIQRSTSQNNSIKGTKKRIF